MHKKLKHSHIRTATLILVGLLIIFICAIGCGPTGQPTITSLESTSALQSPSPALTPTWPPDCAPNAILISALYSSEVDFYLKEIMQSFNQSSAAGGQNPDSNVPLTVGGKPICVTGRKEKAGNVRTGIINAINAPNNANVLQPTIWLPSASTWLRLANADAGQDLFDIANTKATANAPVVIATWQSRLDAIRNKVGYIDIGWGELLAVSANPNGWCAYGLSPCRPAVYYGHTNPFNSPTGFSTLISEFYASARANGFTKRKLDDNAVKRTDILLGVHEIEALIRHYSETTTEFKFYIAQGPEYVDFVALEENDVIYINQGKDPFGTPIITPPEPLIALYPKEGTFIHDHPFGIVNAPWVTPEEHDAALVFRDYVLTEKSQKLILSKGFRPSNPNVTIAFPIDPVNGVDPNYPKTLLDIPDIETLLKIQESWGYVKKQADITFLIDVSGSMKDYDKLIQAKAAALAFLDKMKNDSIQHDNRVGLNVFNDQFKLVIPLASLETNEESLLKEIGALIPSGGTALYDALVATMNNQNQDDCEHHIHAIILLSDGRDADSQQESLPTVQKAIEDSQDSACPILVIVVAYGSDADTQTLRGIARSSKTELQIGDPSTIEKILDVIRSFF